jgi:hypothetical protein
MVKRFHVDAPHGDFRGMAEAADGEFDAVDGDWVRWEDYEALRGEIEKIRAHTMAQTGCTPAERAVLDAMAKARLVVPSFDGAVPYFRDSEDQLEVMRAELARRQGKTGE